MRMSLEEFKTVLSLKRLLLILIDTIIYIFAWGMIGLLSDIQIGSMKINGDITIIKIVVLYVLVILSRVLSGSYSCIWRYADATVFIKLLFADVVSFVVFFFAGRFTKTLSIGFAYSITIFLFFSFITLFSRFFYQYLYELHGYGLKIPGNSFLFGEYKASNKNEDKIKVAIVGAGSTGVRTLTAIRKSNSNFEPIAFIECNKSKIGANVNGIHVYIENAFTMKTLKEKGVEAVILAANVDDAEAIKRLNDMYSNNGFHVYTFDVNDGKSDLKFRKVKIEDLLFRPVNSHVFDANDYYEGKVVLVTGGGGSIGSELCRQIAERKPAQLIILDIYENNAYEIQQELIRKFGNKLDVRTIIASVRDEKRMDEVFSFYRPQIVFHAAAHKHVPLMEKNACEAIKNNVFGTYNVANLAEKYAVDKFLLVSTDKAVNPTNIMGATKRMCEMIINCRKDSKTEFCAVRFGNVLGSNGSVIPLFERQIEAGGPITITDKRIIRYFMTIPEAVGLIMETCAIAKGGELFVLNMGQPVKIIELAESLIRMKGLKPYEDIDIVEVGLRPGEKLYEELLISPNKAKHIETENSKIFVERDVVLSRDEVDEKLNRLSSAISSQGSFFEHGYHDAVIEAIKDTIPTYKSPEVINAKVS